MAQQRITRAQYIDMLWQLKHAFEQTRQQGIRFIHFNRMLKDETYRTEVIEQASQSDSPALRAIAEQLLQVGFEGVLTASASEAASVAFKTPEVERSATKKSMLIKPWHVGLGSVSVIAAAALSVGFFDQSVSVSGNISGDKVWQSSKVYTLKDIIYVTPGSTLTIEAGTTIKGESGSALVVANGARLQATGSIESPIVFTSSQTPGSRAAGDWGGLVMLGDAPVNGGEDLIEGLNDQDGLSLYGGSDSSHNCGVLQYARIEFAGFEIGMGNELNGLTLGGCGDQTLISHVQIHRGLDDGLEIFGGTTSVSYILVTGAGDDMFDWDKGWQGNAQFLIGQQYHNLGDHGFEIDSNNEEPTLAPRTLPRVSNVTLISDRSEGKANRAVSIDSGAGGDYRNILMLGFSGESIDLTTQATTRLLASGQLSFDGLVAYDIGPNRNQYFELETGENDDDGGFSERSYFTSLSDDVVFGENPYLLGNSTDQESPTYHPSFRSPVNLYGVNPPPGEFFEQGARYVGAVKPGADEAWYTGWSAFPIN
ncbi:hypothetical protein [Salinibius halmophilus]|uniref:hypothetical protein n=1 Tax=Salinibius halmophilus TaxID=1853216 RepID=UPI000E668552|nr:hypothetical protein [Salinibius halmophilus]